MKHHTINGWLSFVETGFGGSKTMSQLKTLVPKSWCHHGVLSFVETGFSGSKTMYQLKTLVPKSWCHHGVLSFVETEFWTFTIFFNFDFTEWESYFLDENLTHLTNFGNPWRSHGQAHSVQNNFKLTLKMKKSTRLFPDTTIKNINYLLSVPKSADPFLREYIDSRQKMLWKQRFLKMFSFANRKASFFEEKNVFDHLRRVRCRKCSLFHEKTCVRLLPSTVNNPFHFDWFSKITELACRESWSKSWKNQFLKNFGQKVNILMILQSYSTFQNLQNAHFGGPRSRNCWNSSFLDRV